MNSKERRIRNSDRRSSNARRRRRRRRSRGGCGCGSCLITLLVLLVVFCGVLYGGAFFAWNKFVEPQVGVSLNQALGVIGSLYSYDEDKIVTKPYKASDATAFYTSLSNALYLDDSVNLRTSLFEVLNSYASTMLGGESTAEGDGQQVQTSDQINPDENQSGTSGTETGETSEEFTTGNEALDSFLNELEFDFSRLEDYEDEYATPQILEITDKQVAAFLNDVIGQVLSSDSVDGMLSEAMGSMPISISKDTIKSAIAIPQVIVNNKNLLNLENVSLTLTVQINIRSVVKDVLSSYNKSLGFVANILPKSIFGTVVVYPNNYNAPIDVKLNNGESEKMATIYKIADSVLASSGSSLNDMLISVNQKVVGIFEQIQDIVPVNFVDSGSIEVKPINALMKVMNITNVTETQFMCMIRDVCLPDFEDMKEVLGYDSSFDYDDIDSTLDSGVTQFIGELENKYGVEQGYFTKDNITDLFSTSGSSSESTTISSLADHISLSQLSLDESTYAADDYKVAMSYPGFASLMNSYLNPAESEEEGSESSTQGGEAVEGSGEGGSSSGLENMDISIINSFFVGNTNTLSVVAEVGLLSTLASSMDQEGLMYKLMSQLIPEKIYLVLSICLTDSKTDIAINGKTIEETKSHLQTLQSLASGMGMDMSSFSYDSLTESIGPMITSALDGIEDTIGAAIIFDEDAVYLPNVYEVMSATVFQTEEGSEVEVTAQDVYLTLHALKSEMPASFEAASSGLGFAVNTSKETVQTNTTGSITNFISEFTSKYAIDNSDQYIRNTNVYTRLTEMGSDSTIINRINLESLNLNANTYSANTYKVSTEYLALAGILESYMNANQAEASLSSENYDLVNVAYNSENNSLEIMIAVNASKLISLDETSEGYSLISQIMPTNIYIKASVGLEKVEDQIVCGFEIVGLEDGTETIDFLTRLQNMTTALGIDLSVMNYDSLADILGTSIFDGLAQLTEQLGTGITFEDSQALLPSLYNILAGKVLYSADEGAENFSDEDVYFVFKDLQQIPEEYQISNKAETVNGVVNEINSKYYLSDTSKISTTSATPIVDQVTALASNYDTAIVGSNLAAAWKTAAASASLTQKQALLRSDFSPKATEGEMANLLANAVTVTSTGLENIVLDSLYVASETSFTLVYTCDYQVQEGQNDYSGVIPKFVIVATLDLAKIDTTELCCTLTINDMSQGVGGTLEKFMLMCSRLSGSASFSIDQMNTDCDTTIKDNLTDLFNKMSLTLDPAEGSEAAAIYIGSIYEAAYNNVKTETTTFTAVDVADTITALHNGLVVTGQDNIQSQYNASATGTEDDTMASPFVFNLDSMTLTGSVSARNVGAKIYENGLDTLGSNIGLTDGSLSFYQTAFIDCAETTYATEAGDLTNSLSTLFASKTSGKYLVVSLQIATSGLSYASSLLPANLYFTAIIDMTTGSVEIAYNNLNATEISVISALSGNNAAFSNSTSTQIESYLKDIVIFSYSEYGYDVNIKLGDVIGNSNCAYVSNLNGGKICGQYDVVYTVGA